MRCVRCLAAFGMRKGSATGKLQCLILFRSSQAVLVGEHRVCRIKGPSHLHHHIVLVNLVHVRQSDETRALIQQV
jgi:hypothetical protein